MIEILNYVSLGMIPAFVLLDLLWRYKRYTTTRFWRFKGLVMSAVAFYVATQVALFWGHTLEGIHLLDGSVLGTLGGALVGLVVYEFFHYWYHRAAHHFTWLWRAGHQMHHASEGLDIFGAYYLHPIDAAMFTTLKSIVFFPLLGLAPEAGAIGAALLSFNALFQHANIKTPRWLGYVFQRPESHSLHHARGVHRFNYADLPFWDMVFGTFRNPEAFQEREGFYAGASDRVAEMLLFQDVSQPLVPMVEAGPAFPPSREAT